MIHQCLIFINNPTTYLIFLIFSLISFSSFIFLSLFFHNATFYMIISLFHVFFFHFESFGFQYTLHKSYALSEFLLHLLSILP